MVIQKKEHVASIYLANLIEKNLVYNVVYCFVWKGYRGNTSSRVLRFSQRGCLKIFKLLRALYYREHLMEQLCYEFLWSSMSISLFNFVSKFLFYNVRSCPQNYLRMTNYAFRSVPKDKSCSYFVITKGSHTPFSFIQSMLRKFHLCIDPFSNI